MKAYPQELRERVVAAYEQKIHSLSEVAELFGVGLTFLKTMLKRHRKGESLAPLPVGGSSPSLDDSHLAMLRAAVETSQDATLEELQEFLAAECEVGVSRPTVCRALQKLDLPRKKKVSWPANASPKRAKRSAAK
jgi:transposase